MRILPVDGFRQLSKDHFFRAHVPGKARPGVGKQFFFRGLARQFDKGAGHLAPFFIGHRHNRDKTDRRMRIQSLFDLDGGDVFAARNDDVLGAVADLDIAIGVLHRDVAGPEPAVLEGLGGFFLGLQIALHDDVAAKYDLAQCFAIPWHGGARSRDRGPARLPQAHRQRPDGPSVRPVHRAGSSVQWGFSAQTTAGP